MVGELDVFNVSSNVENFLLKVEGSLGIGSCFRKEYVFGIREDKIVEVVDNVVLGIIIDYFDNKLFSNR